MGSLRAHRSLLLLSLLCSFYSHSAAQNAGRQIPAAVVVGTVYCDTCFHQEFSKAGHLISGASVAVECGGAATAASFSKEAKTNRHGVFRVRLPPRINKHMDLIRSCSVKLVRSNEPFCAVASSATSVGLQLSSKEKGVHVFSAGFFSFRPLNQPALCYQTPKTGEQKQNEPAFFLPIPPIPLLPSPSVGGIPNPLQPPPSLLPPILPPLLPPIVPPLQPLPSLLPPPSGLLPPLPLQPPSPPAFNLPPLPILTPPAPPTPGFPLPQLPLPPNPLFPGNPPAAPSKKTFP